MLRLARLAPALAVLLLAASAAAQTPTPLAYWQLSVGEVLVPLAGPVPEWEINLGGGASVVPRYTGAGRYEMQPSLAIDIRYRDIAFLSDGDGLGVNLLRGKTYRAGIAVGYDIGRNHHDDPRLRTLANIDAAPEFKIFAEAFVLPVVISATARQALGGHSGFIADVGTYVPFPLGEDIHVFVGPTVTFANATYMKAYFGVSPSEAAGTPLRVFTPGGGLKSTGLGVTGEWRVSEHWLVESDGAFQYLLGDAGNSPIVEQRSQLTLSINAVYRF